jgi:Uma2 family endonuclease
MLHSVEHPPRTMMEVYKILPEGTLAEIINGSIYMSPSPVALHQRIMFKLGRMMAEWVEANQLGEIFVAPFDVYLDEHANAVQPDIIFVSNANAHIVQDHIHGVPDLLVEILSPGNPSHDLVLKKNLYEKSGVKEYWVVDPLTKETTGYRLAEGRFEKLEGATGYIDSPLLNLRFPF